MTLLKRTTNGARPLRLLALAGSSLALAGFAYADGTTAGTPVENTFTLNYEVSGTAQDTITNDTSLAGPGVDVQGTETVFTVDRLVDLTVTAVNTPQTVSPGATGTAATLVFEVTNTGNDNQSYTFSLQDGVDSNGAAANFDATAVTITYQIDDDGTAGFGPGDTTLTVPAVAPGTGSADLTQRTPDIAADTTFRVLVSGTIPGTQADGTADDLILIAETRDPTAWAFEAVAPAAGAPTAATRNGTVADQLAGVAENVLADGFGTAQEAVNDGLFSAQGTFLVASPDLTATKIVDVIATQGSNAAAVNGLPAVTFDCATDPQLSGDQFAVPGSCLEYVISVTNNGATATATNIVVRDVLPDNVTFAGATFGSNFTGAALSQPAAGTDCDGPGGTACVVELTGASLAAGLVGTVNIRVLVQ
ncbi:MAG: hypothetical protein AAGK23_10630 [Pseudomonadota bacterium]